MTTELYSAEEVMKILRVRSYSTFYLYVRNDGLPAIKVGKKYLVPRKDFERWLLKKAESTKRELRHNARIPA